MLSLMANRAINLFLTVLFLAAFSHGATEQQPTEPAAWSLYDIVTTDTVQTILSDERLRKTYRAAVSACVDTSRNLAEQLQVPELSTISDSLDSHLREFDSQTDTAGRDQLRKRGPSKDTHRDTKRDGFIDGLVSAGAGLGGGAGPALGAAPLPAIPGLPPTPAPPMDSGAGGITGAISQAASGLIGKVVSMSGPAVAQAGFFGGVGAGEGAAQGLNLAPPGTSMTTGAQVAQENGMTSSGFNSAIESAAMGLTATTLRAVRGSNTLQIPNLGPVALAMGGGLGNGAAMGLQLKTGASGPPLNAPGLDGIAGNFAFGLSRSIAESAKASNLMGQMAGPNGATGMILRFAAPAVSGFGKGLGSGAAVGFGLQPPSGPATMPTAARPDGSIDVSGIAQDFASGLTSRFLANGTATNTISGLTGGQGVLGALPPGTLLKFVRPAASGLGKGLGSGTAVGLGLQPDPGPAAMANAPTADGGFDVGGVVQDFASGLTSRFLANGTAINALGAVAGLTGGLGAKMDIRRVTRGLATGMVAGAFDSTQALGGVKAMLGGQAQMPATPVVDTPVPFDDSVGGAATGFGQGLASSAVMTAYKLVSGGVGMKALKSRGTVLLKRGTSAAVSSDSATQVSDRVRDRVTSLLSPKAMSALTQKAVHVLTSQGPGGLTLVALGLGKSGMLSANAFDANTTGFMKDIIPQGTVSFTKNGNTYNLDGQQLSKALNGPLSEAANGLSINGSSFDRFVALMILHSMCNPAHLIGLPLHSPPDRTSSIPRHHYIRFPLAPCRSTPKLS